LRHINSLSIFDLAQTPRFRLKKYQAKDFQIAIATITTSTFIIVIFLLHLLTTDALLEFLIEINSQQSKYQFYHPRYFIGLNLHFRLIFEGCDLSMKGKDS